MKKKSAFTFIEVIIAITVFAIGVLAVLRLITQNLVTLDTTQARTTATFLAKEGIELIYNMRDSNIDKLLPWDCLLDPVLSANDFGEIDEEKVCLRRFADGTKGDKILQLSFDPESYMHVAVVEADEMFDELRKQNRLYYLSWEVAGTQLFRYSYDETGKETPYARYVTFAKVHDGDEDLPSDRILKIESHVLYVKWGMTGEVVLESFIWNH